MLSNSTNKMKKRKTKKRHCRLTIVLELLCRAVTIRGGEKPPCRKVHLQLSPLSHLDRRSSLQQVIQGLSSHTRNDINTHTQTHRQLLRGFTYEGSGKCKDIPKSPGCVQVSQLSRLISQPIFKKAEKSAAEALGLRWMMCRRRSLLSPGGGQTKGKAGTPRKDRGRDCGPNSWTSLGLHRSELVPYGQREEHSTLVVCVHVCVVSLGGSVPECNSWAGQIKRLFQFNLSCTKILIIE